MHSKSRRFWGHKVQSCLQQQSTILNTSDGIGFSTVVYNCNAINNYVLTWHSINLSSVLRQQLLQPEYALAPYLSAVKNFRSRKLVSRFSRGCHGLHVDTGRLLPSSQQVLRDQRHCLVWNSGTAEDEHHFVSDCPAYCSSNTNPK